MTAAEKLLRGTIACSCDCCKDIKSALPYARAHVPICLVQNVWDYLAEQESPLIRAEDAPGCFCPWREIVLTFEDCGGLEYAVAGGLDSTNRFIGQVFHSVAGEDHVYHAGHFVITVEEDGQVHGFRCQPRPRQKPDAETRNYEKQVITNAAGITSLSFSFANCKNVRIEKVSISRQVRRRAERTREPIFEHHVLLIDPMKEVLRFEGGIGQHGLVKALHICRGHFACYGPEYGRGYLFGRKDHGSGRFWVSQHTRGSRTAGVVTKDYVVEAARGTE